MRNLLILFLIAFGAVQAWGPAGHIIVAKIAEWDLQLSDPEAFSRAESHILITGGVNSDKSDSFARASIWMDNMKGLRLRIFNDLHFIDVPYDRRAKVPRQIRVSALTYKMNILAGIRQSLEFLGNKDIRDHPSFESSLMMRWLIHFIGDLHQPLHCTAMYSKIFPRGDMGGNLIKLNKKENLHSFWDDGADRLPSIPLDRLRNFARETEYREAVYEAGKSIMEEHPRESFTEALSKTKIETWAKESYQLAKEYSYAGLDPNSKKATLSQEYTDKAYKLIRKQIALAGFRLADLIRMLFSKSGFRKYKVSRTWI